MVLLIATMSILGTMISWPASREIENTGNELLFGFVDDAQTWPPRAR